MSEVFTKDYINSRHETVYTGGRKFGAPRLMEISRDRIFRLFEDAKEALNNGYSNKAEKLIVDALSKYKFSVDDFAELTCLLSYCLETKGEYPLAFEAIAPYEAEEVLSKLRKTTRVRAVTQLAVCYYLISDSPKAVSLLKDILNFAKENELKADIGNIYVALSRVYRKLGQYPIARDLAEKGLVFIRDEGDWYQMADAYREIALSYHQEGDSEKAIRYFELGIQIIGDRSSPFLLGKICTDLSGAFIFLRRPHEGIAYLEKSIKYFEQTEHRINSIVAYNNLGLNLMQIGEWRRAEEMILRALEIAEELEHLHIAGILDSLGELKLLRGDYETAEQDFLRGVEFANQKNQPWYAIQGMRNLARLYLRQRKIDEAIEQASETIAICTKIGDKITTSLARLILAEAHLIQGDLESCEFFLNEIESTNPINDFFVLGTIQRIRGLIAETANSEELALHHYGRALTIFETAHDLYHTAWSNLLIGRTLPPDQKERAEKHLNRALEVFKKLENFDFIGQCEKALSSLVEPEIAKPAAQKHSGISHLVTVRLAEATASRELLFRELTAILQLESRASKFIIAEFNEQKRLFPFISHGISATDSVEIVSQFAASLQKSDERSFSTSRNFAHFPLKPASAPTAYLLVGPRNSAVLHDGSNLNSLLKIVELGLDLISLRERDKGFTAEEDSVSYASQTVMPGFIHSSPAMTLLVDEVHKIRSSDVTVLVTGESGTGKELVSRAIHATSNRKDEIFIPFNCTAVPKELAEGHLFGYRKGAFTGAVTDSPGMIRAADGGTLFLDEVGDLPIDVQPKLLRFLQEGEVQPIGEKSPIKVDVRVIAATNMPLEQKVADGTFREDLYYRLNVIRLRVPPLRERRSEIPPMVNYYINHYSQRFGKRDITITPSAMDLLMVCNWDGNVRQLCNEVQRLVARAENGDVFTPDELSPEIRRSAKPLSSFADNSIVRPITSFDGSFGSFDIQANSGTLEEAVAELEKQMITSSLQRNKWNISRVSRELGLTRRGLYLKLARYSIEKAS